MTSTDRPIDDAEPTAKAEDRWSFARFLVTLAILAWAIRSLVVAPFSIPSGSMLPTLYIGDYLIVAKWPYGYSRYSFPLQIPPIDGRLFGSTPERGDVVVFRHPVTDDDLIKRVMAVPGDTVEVRDGAVVLNGQPLKRDRPQIYRLPISPNTPCKTVPPAPPRVVTAGGQPVCLFNTYRETLPGGLTHRVIDQLDGGMGDSFGPVTVPQGRVFLMGDNRDDSLDSRFATAEGGVGLVPVENIIGRALVTFWSTDGAASYFNPFSWLTALRVSRVGNGYEGEAE